MAGKASSIGLTLSPRRAVTTAQYQTASKRNSVLILNGLCQTTGARSRAPQPGHAGSRRERASGTANGVGGNGCAGGTRMASPGLEMVARLRDVVQTSAFDHASMRARTSTSPRSPRATAISPPQLLMWPAPSCGEASRLPGRPVSGRRASTSDRRQRRANVPPKRADQPCDRRIAGRHANTYV